MTGMRGLGYLKEHLDMGEIAEEIQKRLKISAHVRSYDVPKEFFIAINYREKPLKKDERSSYWQGEVWQATNGEYAIYSGFARAPGEPPMFKVVYRDDVVDAVDSFKKRYLKQKG
jgi:hypothetical protein